MKTVMVTGGAGFIGSTLVRRLLARSQVRVVNLDALTYAGNLDSLADLMPHSRHIFAQGDIADQALVGRLLSEYEVTAVLHLAAESHVDRSIDDPLRFVTTNVVGTTRLLEAVKKFWLSLPGEAQARFRFVHVSTDEVFGSLGAAGAFAPDSPYHPNSPYAASKAAADHFVRAYGHTYGLPIMVTNSSNNYGPRQFPEKLVPLMIEKGLAGQTFPLYGDGQHVRDWLYVDDHADALATVLEQGRAGETYTIGGNEERTNRDVVETICRTLDRLRPRSDGVSRVSKIAAVPDRPGHDRRYAMDIAKIRDELGWRPRTSFAEGIEKTVAWYLEHRDWVARIGSGIYRGERLGLPDNGPSPGNS